MSEETQTVEREVQDTSGIDHLDEKTQAEIRKLRKEAAERRTKNKELEDELSKVRSKMTEIEKQKLAEDGKLKELLERTEAEKKELELKAKKVDDYETILTKQLDAGMKGLGKEDVEYINGLQLPLVQKIELAAKLKGHATSSTDSPASSRPGGVTENAAKVFERIDAEKDTKKRAQILRELKTQNPQLYNQYLTGG